MYVYIYQGQIAGHTNNPDIVPDGFQLYEYPEQTGLEGLYFDGKEVKQKPPQPSSSAYWDSVNHQWVEPQMYVPPTPEPSFTESELFQKSRELAKTNPEILTEMVIALFAEYKGDKTLLDDAKNRLEKLQPKTSAKEGVKP